jgi:hypothetical protein
VEPQAGFPHTRVARKLAERNGEVRVEIEAGERNADHAPGREVQNRRARPAAEGDGIVRQRQDLLAERTMQPKLDHLAGHDALHARFGAQNGLLQRLPVARIELRVADDRDLAALQCAGIFPPQFQRRTGRRLFQAKQRDVEMRVDHHHLGDRIRLHRGVAAAAPEVDARHATRQEPQLVHADARGKHFGDVPGRDHQIRRHAKSRAHVGRGLRRRVFQLTNGGDRRGDARVYERIVEVSPRRREVRRATITDRDGRPQLRHDDSLEALGLVIRNAFRTSDESEGGVDVLGGERWFRGIGCDARDPRPDDLDAAVPFRA